MKVDTVPISIDGMEKSVGGTVRWVAIEPAFTPYCTLSEEERARLMYLAEVQLPDYYIHLPSGVPAQVHLKSITND